MTYDAEVGEDLIPKLLKLLGNDISRFEIVGSLGRHEPKIRDLDILVEPMEGSIPEITYLMRESGDWKKGADRYMCVENILGSPLQLDLYLCHPPAQWGVLTAVRLNPAPLVIYGKKIIDQKGYRREGGTIFSAMAEVRVPEEEDWFKLIDVEFVPPEERWELTRRLRLI